MNTLSAAEVTARPQIRALANSRIREVANAAMGRSDVLPFWFGESDQPTPHFIRAEAARSILEGETFYSQNLGRLYLREAIASYLGDLHERPIGVERIAAVNSGDTGLMLASQLVLSPGSRVVAITPLWPNLLEIPKILGAHVERFALQVWHGAWSLDVERLLSRLTPDTTALIVNSPNNPTGWTIDETSLQAILSHCRKHGIWILADDVYERLIYSSNRRLGPSFLRHYEEGDRILAVNSFSKAWSMTGWRVGWMVVPESLSADLAKVIEYNFSCIFEPVQRAATVALREGEPDVARLRAHLARTRAILSGELSAIPGVEVPDAGGAMYVFFRIDKHENSLDLAKQLVSRVGLGLAPGSAFGPEGEGWLRWCHAVEETKLREGIDRFRRFMNGSAA